MSEDRFKEIFRRITAETPDAPAFSDLETHRATPAAPNRLKPWMAATGAAVLVLVVVGAFGLLGGGGPDLAAPDENTIDYVKLEYSATVNPVCEGGEIIDNGGFDQATIEIWGPNSDDLTLMVATFPDGTSERTVVEGLPTNPDYVWVEGDPEDYPNNTKLRVVSCKGADGPLREIFSLGGAMAPFHLLGPPPGFETWSESFYPSPEPIATEWNGNSVLLYEERSDVGGGLTLFDLYVSEDDRRVLRFHAEQSLPGLGDAVVDYSTVEVGKVPVDSVSLGTTGLTAIAQVFELGAEDCPVTIPSQGFTPPDGYPATPSDPDAVWFGKDELWTALSTDGTYDSRKSVWWSVNFRGGSVEPEPELTVRYTLLNSPRSLTFESTAATNAHTDADGWFIIAGIDTKYAGCWEVTAIYKDASLSFVYYNPDGADPEPVVPDVVGMTVERAGNVLHDAGYEASFHDSADPTYEVCAQEPGPGLELDPGETIGMRTAPPGECDELSPKQPPDNCASDEPLTGQVAVFFHCGDSEYPRPQAVVRYGIPGVDPKAAVFVRLVAGPTDEEVDRGFASFFGPATANAVVFTDLQQDHLVVNFTPKILVNNASTASGSTFFLAELYANAFQFEEVESVEFQVNGSCEAFWEFLQAGPECNITDRAGWEQMQSQWDSG